MLGKDYFKEIEDWPATFKEHIVYYVIMVVKN